MILLCNFKHHSLKIRQLLVACAVVLLIPKTSLGTVRCYTTYDLSNFQLNICYNHAEVSAYELLKYKGISELLNDYVSRSIDEGKLQDKKVIMEIGCVVFADPLIDMFCDESSYSIFIQGWPELEYMVKIVGYFSHPDWEPHAIPPSYVDENAKEAREAFNEKLDKLVGKPNMEFFKDKEVGVFSVGDLEISYANDTVLLKINDMDIPVKMKNIYPVQFKNRYLVFGQDSIFVYENNEQILRYPIDYGMWKEDSFDYLNEKHSDWLNVYYNNKEIPVFSYCYSKNMMYSVHKLRN